MSTMGLSFNHLKRLGRNSKDDSGKHHFPFQQHPTPAVPTMPTDYHILTLQVQTHVLKVNVNCHGCRLKVKKVLKKIEGVYAVNIDAEQQKVTVRGVVDPSTLIKKLIKSGKQAELCNTQISNQDTYFNQEQANLKNQMHYYMNQLPFPTSLSGGGAVHEDGWECEEGQQEHPLLEHDMENLDRKIDDGYGDIHCVGQGKGRFQGFEDDHPAGFQGYAYDQSQYPSYSMMMAYQNSKFPLAGFTKGAGQTVQGTNNNNMIMADGFMRMNQTPGSTYTYLL
ncbi:hypothetical protein Dimus_023212 [Dionaea muscipula]